MDSHKENADSDLYLDLLCLRTYKVDPFLILFDELKRDRFWNVEEMDRFKDGYTRAVEEYKKLFHEYSHLKANVFFYCLRNGTNGCKKKVKVVKYLRKLLADVTE